MDSATLIILILSAIILCFFLSWFLRNLKGKMDIVLPKSDYSLGENILGVITIYPKKNIQADHITLSLICTERREVRRGNNTSTETYTLHEDTQTMPCEPILRAREKIEIPFEIFVPKISLDRRALQTGIEFIDKLAKYAAKFNHRRIYWNLHAQLHCDGVDLQKTQTIYVR